MTEENYDDDKSPRHIPISSVSHRRGGGGVRRNDCSEILRIRYVPTSIMRARNK